MSGRRERWGLALLIAFAAAGTLLAVRQSALSQRTADFTIGYSAAVLVREGHADRVYDPSFMGPTMERVAGGAPIDPRLPFDQPLAAVAPYLPLTALPVDLAFRVWQVATVLIFLSAFLTLQRPLPLGPRAPLIGLLGILASVPAWSTLTEGQATPLLLLGACLLASAILSGRAWPALAGAALLALKPQYLAAFIILLVVRRHVRPLLAAIAGAAAVLLSPLAAGGFPNLVAWVHSALASDQVTPVRLSETWGGSLAAILPARLATPAALIVFTGGMLAVLAVAVAGRRDPLPVLALASWIAVLASPHALPHDLVLLSVPAWCAIALARSGRLPSPVQALMVCDAALLVDALSPPLLVGPIALTGALLTCAILFRRRAASIHSPSMPAAA